MEGSRTERDKGKRRRAVVHERDQERSEGFMELHSMRSRCCSSQAYIKVGIVSDTHGCFDARLRDIFDGVHEIWHGGDHAGKNGSYQSAWDVLKELNNIAPVTCMVRGNVDTFAGGIRGQKGFSTNTPLDFTLDFPLYSVRQGYTFDKESRNRQENLHDCKSTDEFVAERLQDITGDPANAQEVVNAHRLDVIVFGHSHQSRIWYHEGRLFINPGSAGPRRFSLPKSACTLEIHEEKFIANIYRW
ncbi:hypothetical protein GUITHDRAFT_110861 [Guillardia theta CCMP2712]|uniref:Vacuolar protein sorting-associated protein 29 n=1 Tax=Guillardia theta (strain CCMP2712) TaxID=905079 RepID=L1J3M8_GUITC|nr:hypothetical protein GUITHDRAFT_110861 [Guillardia theta CCMP2712]EKX43133.1 hypothetical protein GUITHDRAFT_110861 [Guillardia theta CCMP2712]|eukprot:XP_005830113.1 hypothetical protein GUITHDRAFT_110861 [Guillardia theta CCMP2712]